MFGMDSFSTLVAICVIMFFVAVIATNVASAWRDRGSAREKTKQLASKAQIARAEADVQMVTGWQPPKAEPTAAEEETS